MDSSRRRNTSTRSSSGASGTNKSPLTNGIVSAPPPPKFIIQQWHVVLGDTHARADRTTIATDFAREIKEKFKKNYKGVKKCEWIPLAMKELRQRLVKEKFPLSQANPPLRKSDIGLVLVKCTPKASDRIKSPHLYGYHGDKEAWYGVAVADKALEFFFGSQDAPSLTKELARHMRNFQSLLQKNLNEQPPPSMMSSFRKKLVFFQETHDEAARGDVLSIKLLESLRPINALKEQFKVLTEYKAKQRPPQHSRRIESSRFVCTPARPARQTKPTKYDRAHNVFSTEHLSKDSTRDKAGSNVENPDDGDRSESSRADRQQQPNYLACLDGLGDFDLRLLEDLGYESTSSDLRPGFRANSPTETLRDNGVAGSINTENHVCDIPEFVETKPASSAGLKRKNESEVDQACMPLKRARNEKNEIGEANNDKNLLATDAAQSSLASVSCRGFELDGLHGFDLELLEDMDYEFHVDSRPGFSTCDAIQPDPVVTFRSEEEQNVPRA